uniref:Serine/threonine-protein kinase Nek2 n=1 Tax=Phallusia mammillata TaxID=59560 RepID=A0A6F9DLG9_9ASCI|nr:serine/threonine-protein kinase Nek2 [Phallusia mammillata]
MPSKLSDYDILYQIGSGSYGKCLKVRRRSDSKILVWKDMDYGSMTEPEKQQLVSEVNLLRELKHRFIVRYHDRIIDRSKSRLYLIMEYCAGGDLASLITKYRKERRFMEEEFILKIFVQLILALQSCHGQRQKSGNQGKILHRDLKPANVFLDENHNVKLGDFGLARVLHHDTSFAKTFVGTPYYMSPEQMSKAHYNEKSDLWSLGCLVYELCALVPPFTAPNQRLLAVKIKEGRFRRIPSKYSDELHNCISSMLRLTSTARPSLEDLLQLPLLRNIVAEYSEHVTPAQPEAKPSTPPAEPQERVLQAIEGKLAERRISSSSTSSGEVRRLSPDAALRAKESALDEKSRELERRERDLKRKERLLDEREKAAEEKMKTAESLIRQYRELRSDQKLFGAANKDKYGLDAMDHRKQVHFAAEAKENDPAYYGLDNYRYALGKKENYGAGKPVVDYRRKLRDLKLNEEQTKKYGRVPKFDSDVKVRHILGMR